MQNIVLNVPGAITELSDLPQDAIKIRKNGTISTNNFFISCPLIFFLKNNIANLQVHLHLFSASEG